MTLPNSTRDALLAGVRTFISSRADGSKDEETRDALLAEVASYQADRVQAYGRLVRARARGRRPGQALPIADFPALPTDVFRFARVAAHPEADDARVFRTSGTSSHSRGTHALRDLTLYDHAAERAARYALFPDGGRMRLLILAPHESEAPDSSLSYMLTRFERWFGDGNPCWAWRDGELDVKRLTHALDTAETEGTKVALLGTSFAFVHLMDAHDIRRVTLPAGSRIMQTGGFKGRSRTVPADEMRSLLSAHFGIDARFIVSEYGMTELSSQMYETTLRDALGGGAAHPPRHLWVPGWMRITPVDPDTLEPVAEGNVGLLRIDDMANLDTACCIQTADLGRRVGEGVEVLGRAGDAVPRGCSLAADAALGQGRKARG